MRYLDVMPGYSGNSSTLAPSRVTDARTVAAQVLTDLRGGSILDVAFEERARHLDGRDRRWTQELVFGMLRRRAWIDMLLAQCVRGGLARLDPDLSDLLRLGAYQLLHMGSVPAYAAIAQTVELAKERGGLGASKLANAVLRRLDRERDSLAVPDQRDPVAGLALKHSHPRWLVARWVARWGAAGTEALLAANNVEAPLVVRPWGVVREQLEAMLEAAGVEVGEAPLAPDSISIRLGGALTELGAFQQGHLFVQDPAATMVTRYSAIESGSVVADLCSAPGGKCIELSRDASAVVAADASLTRLGRLRESISRLELANVWPLVADARAPSLRQVDAVLIDVPCTNTGTFRRHPDARWRLTPSTIGMMAAAQRAILRSAATLVRPGGLLIYSTCSLEPEENEEQVELFVAEHPGWILEPPPQGAVPESVLDEGFLRVLPQVHGTDGAFAARLRRRRNA